MTDTSADELRQKLATIEHERWSDWQNYVFSVCHQPNVQMTGGDSFGDMVIPREYVERWVRQMATKYPALSEAEQASDMEQVDRYWPLIEAYLAAHERALLDSLLEQKEYLCEYTNGKDWPQHEAVRASVIQAKRKELS